jgi:hypothetical protein
MKTLLTILAMSLLASTAFGQLVLTGAFDGPLTGGVPKGVELCAVMDIADLSEYGIGCANNGGGTDGEEFTFPAVSVTAGTFLYLASEEAGFTSFFGFAPDYVDSYAAGTNGDDAFELFHNGQVVDVLGDINTDGTGTAWDYMDGWIYRVNNTPDSPIFDETQWFTSGINAWDGELDNATAAVPFPVASYTYDPSVATEGSSLTAVKALFQ